MARGYSCAEAIPAVTRSECLVCTAKSNAGIELAIKWDVSRLATKWSALTIATVDVTGLLRSDDSSASAAAWPALMGVVQSMIRVHFDS